jgi:hypothetical protein
VAVLLPDRSNAFGKSDHVDDAELVEASADDLAFVSSFELKRDFRTVGLDDTRHAADGLADW